MFYHTLTAQHWPPEIIPRQQQNDPALCSPAPLKSLTFWRYTNQIIIISERELLYAIARLSVVCNVRVPYSGGSKFPQYFYGVRYLGHPLTSTENFTEIVPGELLRWGS